VAESVAKDLEAWLDRLPVAHTKTAEVKLAAIEHLLAAIEHLVGTLAAEAKRAGCIKSLFEIDSLGRDKK
jgi:hypothetical protein